MRSIDYPLRSRSHPSTQGNEDFGDLSNAEDEVPQPASRSHSRQQVGERRARRTIADSEDEGEPSNDLEDGIGQAPAREDSYDMDLEADLYRPEVCYTLDTLSYFAHPLWQGQVFRRREQSPERTRRGRLGR